VPGEDEGHLFAAGVAADDGAAIESQISGRLLTVMRKKELTGRREKSRQNEAGGLETGHGFQPSRPGKRAGLLSFTPRLY